MQGIFGILESFGIRIGGSEGPKGAKDAEALALEECVLFVSQLLVARAV